MGVNMAGITLAQAQAQLALWLAADAAVASGQSYAMGEKSLTLANAGEIRKNIDYWASWVSSLSQTGASTRTGPVVRGVTPT
jgi:hypothetical protein